MFCVLYERVCEDIKYTPSAQYILAIMWGSLCFPILMRMRIYRRIAAHEREVDVCLFISYTFSIQFEGRPCPASMVSTRFPFNDATTLAQRV